MIDKEDLKWLRKALESCSKGANEKMTCDRKLQSFSMLIKNMVKNIERNLNETKDLWEKHPTSKELRERFKLLKQCLFYIERFCSEKVERRSQEGR